MDHFDVIVLGADVVGLVVARELARQDLGARGFASAPMKKASELSKAFLILIESRT
jgi:hypothetical protein